MSKIPFIICIVFILFSLFINILGLMKLYPIYLTSPLLFFSLFLLIALLNNQRRFKGFK
ncbi:MAG: hypothetical protein U9Q88_19350 [Bacillota bacterium]|uniref:hypothetical protein n=1 Tax=Bacillus sp. RO2 TaxID=2723913 RepID=UPI00145F7A5B|nr:hypothetical protein [Bacillus sp. RO2]MEA3322155.1 hypothetical protein [Bacillota bacterium]NMH71877.1 hypothetical protein [Bacillus sp. RO2]